MSRGGKFLGRDKELGVIAAALMEARAGRGSALFVVGEPGIGKTRLADEAAAHPAASGFSVFWGRCWESGGAPAFWPWSQILSAAVRDRGSDETPAPFEGQTAGDFDEGQAARFEIFRTVVELLARLGRDKPLLLVLDDLHAADQSSLLLLHFVAREVRTMRAVIIGTYRDVEARLSVEAGRLLARAGREAHTLALPRLGSDDVAAFVRESAKSASDQAVRAIARTTQGNPLFLDEMVRALMARSPDAPDAGDGMEDGLPFGVREAIAQHLALLPAAMRQVLQVAAVVGNEFDLAPVVAAIGTEASAEASAGVDVDVGAALRDAVAAGVLVVRDRHRLRYAFSHGLLREALYRDLPNSRRTSLHAQVATALERGLTLRGRDPASTALWAELAHHYLEAGPTAVTDAVTSTIKAAEQALDAAAYEDAIALLERARAAAELTPPSPRVRAELVLSEGLARVRAGDSRRGRALCLHAADLARALPDAALFARAALGYGAEFTFALTDPVLVRMLEEALGTLPAADSVLRARALARLASALQPSADPRQPVERAREAIAMARRLGDKTALLAVIHDAMSAMMDFVSSRERVAINLEAEQLASALGDRSRALRARARLVVDYAELGVMAKMDENLAAYEVLAGALKAARYLWPIPLMRSMRAGLEGRFEVCAAALAEAAHLSEQAIDSNRGMVLLFHRFGLYRAQERPDDLLALEPEIKATFSSVPLGAIWQSILWGAVLVRSGRAPEAAALLPPPDSDRSHDDGAAAGANRYDHLIGIAESSMLAFLAEISAGTGDRELAALLYPLLAPRAGDLLCYGMVGLFCEGPYDRQLALLALVLERRQQAVVHFEAAIAKNRQLGLRPHLARVLFEYAEALAAADPEPGGDSPRPAALVAEGVEIARELRMPGLLRQLASLTERLSATGVGPPQIGHQTSSGATHAPAAVALLEVEAPPTFELRREGEYWTVTGPDELLRLKDTRGLRMLHRLIAHPDQEFHATDLVISVADGGASGGEGVKDAGDAGAMLDPAARAAYRHRVAELEETLREAADDHDADGAARARAELEFIADELARAVGLGGRTRRAGSAPERARVAAQKRIKDALKKIEDGAPRVGRHLALTIRTGTFCAYHPGGRRP